MNRPGVGEGNWAWRTSEGALTSELASYLAELSSVFDRDPRERAGRASEPKPREETRVPA
jgi:4-alpha-glucanotransferase